MSRALFSKRSAYGKFAFAALLAFTFCLALPSSTAQAKKRKLAKYGMIKIQSNPGGLPIEIDGESKGLTTTDYTDFDRVTPGVHTIVITLPNGQRWTREVDLEAGRIKCVVLSYRQPPPVTSPCPYPVTLAVAAEFTEGQTISYTAEVAYTGTSPLTYKWTLSPANARILNGDGTPSITVDSTGFGGQRITATVTVDDGSGDANCQQSAHASTLITIPTKPENPPRLFDTCCACSFDDQKARLDTLGVELQNDPSTTTYIFAYGGRTSRIGQANLLGSRARDYLMTSRSIDASRIIVQDGGFREEDCVELWIVPRGATPPQPSPTVQPGDVRPAPSAPRRRSRRRARY